VGSKRDLGNIPDLKKMREIKGICGRIGKHADCEEYAKCEEYSGCGEYTRFEEDAGD
jgi:hypothetical protein